MAPTVASDRAAAADPPRGPAARSSAGAHRGRRYRPVVPGIAELESSPAVSGVRRLVRACLWWGITLDARRARRPHLRSCLLGDLATGGPVRGRRRRDGGVRAGADLHRPARHHGRTRAVREFFLDRLDLQRRSNKVADREARLRSRVVGAASAIALTFLIGGVLPPVILWRQGYSARLRATSVVRDRSALRGGVRRPARPAARGHLNAPTGPTPPADVSDATRESSIPGDTCRSSARRPNEDAHVDLCDNRSTARSGRGPSAVPAHGHRRGRVGRGDRAAARGSAWPGVLGVRCGDTRGSEPPRAAPSPAGAPPRRHDHPRRPLFGQCRHRQRGPLLDLGCRLSVPITGRPAATSAPTCSSSRRSCTSCASACTDRRATRSSTPWSACSRQVFCSGPWC